MRNIVHRIQSYKFFSLLVSLIVLMIVSPFFEADDKAAPSLAALFSLVLLSAVFAASARRAQFLFAMSLAVPWLVLKWGFGGPGFGGTEIATNILQASLNVFAIILILHRIIKTKEVGFDDLCGAVAIYFLLGVSWALAFGVLEGLAPGTIILSNSDAALSSIDLIYFSFTTLTTLGYGDIAPLSPVARIWSNLEAITGVLYLAVLVSRLVSLYRA